MRKLLAVFVMLFVLALLPAAPGAVRAEDAAPDVTPETTATAPVEQVPDVLLTEAGFWRAVEYIAGMFSVPIWLAFVLAVAALILLGVAIFLLFRSTPPSQAANLRTAADAFRRYADKTPTPLDDLAAALLGVLLPKIGETVEQKLRELGGVPPQTPPA